MATKKESKPKILKVVRTDTHVEIVTEETRSSEHQKVNNPEKPGEQKEQTVTASREYKEKAPEAPLPKFDETLQALGPVVAKVFGVGPEWGKEGMTIVGVIVSYTEKGIRSAQILFSKSMLSGESTHPLKTPMFQIDDGKTADQGKKQVHKQHAEAVIDFLQQAQKYAAGERSQQLLDFNDDEEEEDDDKIEQLPGLAKKDDEAND